MGLGEPLGASIWVLVSGRFPDQALYIFIGSLFLGDAPTRPFNFLLLWILLGATPPEFPKSGNTESGGRTLTLGLPPPLPLYLL